MHSHGCPSAAEVIEDNEEVVQFEGLHSLFFDRFLVRRISEIQMIEPHVVCTNFPEPIAVTSPNPDHLRVKISILKNIFFLHPNA